MTPRRTGAVAVGSVIASALLTLVLVTWAASIGPGGVLRGEGPPSAGPPSPASTSVTPSAQANPLDDTRREAGGVAVGRVLAFLINVLALVFAGWLLLRLARVWREARLLRRRRRERLPPEPDFTVLSPQQVVARVLLEEAEDQRRTLLEGAPRNAVVACWHRFEAGAAAAGLERQPWETSSEFTMRVLDLVDADQPAVSRLAALYREARFSEHELTEEHRAAAVAALDQIHRTIGVGV